MCIAIYKPGMKSISKEILKECFDSNKDGCGFAYINTDHFGVKRIKVYKTMVFESFYKQYERASRFNPESPFLIHFRIATHGTVDKFNCHPFYINNKTVFIHNGIISGVSKDAKRSDTQMFNAEFLQHIDDTMLLKDGPIKKLIEKFLVGSKIVIMNLDGDVAIYNESSGNWSDGVWYSNYSWKPTQRTYYHQKGNSITVDSNKYRKSLSNTSFHKCEECGTYNQLVRMRAFRNGIDIETYCNNCVKLIEEESKINEVSIGQFIEYNNELALYEYTDYCM